MSRIIERGLLVCSFFILLTACQGLVKQPSAPEKDTFAVAEQVFESHLADNDLGLANQQLAELRNNHPEEQRIYVLSQRLATAWLETGEQALKDGDVETASAALMQAKRLLPQAPALTEGLSAALAAAQTPVLEPAVKFKIPVKLPPAGKQPAQKKPPAVSEPVFDTEIDEISVELPVPETEAPSEPKRSTVKSRLIDVNAQQTVVPMPMLNMRNDYQLGRLLDDVAADVVKFRAAVTIEVADTRDFHWVAALLSARVKKLDANFKPRLLEVIREHEPAQLIIIPNKTL